MLIEILIAIFLGILIGTFTGLFPGIHINLVGALLVSFVGTLFFKIDSIYLIVFITAMAIAHTFLDFVPSIFLGCSDSDNVLSLLPGHELLKEGEGYHAVMFSAYGGLIALFLLIIIFYPSIKFIPGIYEILTKERYIMAIVLIVVTLFLILTESNKLRAIIVIILSGILGYSVLNLENLKQPLLPLLTGLFGTSSLILSIKTKTKIPKQEFSKPEISKKNIFKTTLASLIASPLCGFLPGLGSGQAAVLGNTLVKTDRKGFLMLLGVTNVLVMGISFLALYAIGKTRTGAAASIKELLGNIDFKIIVLIMIVVLISGIISFFLTKYLSIIFAKNINKFDYSKLSIIILIILFIVTFVFSGFLGILVLIVSTFTGIYCISLETRRTNMMGCLLIPTIILYLI